MAKSHEKTIVDNHSFDSSSEAEYYIKLKKAKREGLIKDFEMEPEYILLDGFTDWRGKYYQPMKHYPDYFVTMNDGSKIIIDSKGGTAANHETDAKIKRKIFMQQHPNIKYYYVSKIPKDLGGVWVESSPYFDFLNKLKAKYNKLYPGINKRKKDIPKLTEKDWDKYFIYHNVSGLFFQWEKSYTKKELEKMEKEKLKEVK